MLKKFYLRFDRINFWTNIWKNFEVDDKFFKNLDMYPIKDTLKYTDKKDKILECGFGAGRIIRHLHHSGFDILGIEKDEKIVLRLKKIDPELRIQVGNILNLQFPENTFDTILCFGTIGTIENIDEAIEELKRVLKPNGKLIISSICKNFSRNIQSFLLNFRNYNQKKEFYSWIGTKKDYENYYLKNNFKIISYNYIFSQYALYSWLPFLRSKDSVGNARTTDNYKLNIFGKYLWIICISLFKKHISMGILFTVRNIK